VSPGGGQHADGQDLRRLADGHQPAAAEQHAVGVLGDQVIAQLGVGQLIEVTLP
jgi:hypothetical protein